MIRIDHLTLLRGTKVLLADASVVLHPGDKAGLVGANGSGKSSLFALLRGELHPDQGDCSIPAAWRIAHVAQDAAATQRSAVDHVIDGDAHLRRVQAELENHEASGERLGELHAMLADADGYTVQSRAETLLLGLGFTLEQTRWPVAHFSGGWRMRLNLAQALMCPSDLLLLDEPTNHLDLDAIVWLEQWLRRYPGTLIVISHDREFLDAVCTSIVHIDRQTLQRYSGDYNAFERQRAEQLRLNQAAFARQQLEIAHLQSFVERFRAKASKAKQAQSRVKMLERMDLISPTYTASPFTFHFREPDAAPDPMLTIENLVCGYAPEEGGGEVDEDSSAPRPILAGIDLTLRTGERIGLLGANGQGKSTFIKTLAGTLPPLSGSMLAGKGLRIGYFAQHQIDTLRLDESPLRQLMRIASNTREQELRNYLGSFDFKGEMATAPVAPFSGGEKARLALALIIWEKPNLLLLDEPTNHLDLETREALKIALAQFEGTLILVAHDRALLRATTDRFLLVADGSMRDFDGDLDDYRAWLLNQVSAREISAHGTADARVSGAASTIKTASPTGALQGKPAGNADQPLPTRQAQRRAEADARNAQAARRRPLESRLKRIEKELGTLGTRRQSIEQQLADSALYAVENKEALRQLLFDQAVIAKQTAELESEWLACQEELEQLAA